MHRGDHSAAPGSHDADRRRLASRRLTGYADSAQIYCSQFGVAPVDDGHYHARDRARRVCLYRRAHDGQRRAENARSTGSDDNLLVARKAAMSEIMSIMDREAAGIIVNLPQVARSADGTPISSKEVVGDHQSQQDRRRRHQQCHRARRRRGGVSTAPASASRRGPHVSLGRARSDRRRRDYQTLRRRADRREG